MAYIRIPVRSDFKAYRFQVELESTIYTLDFGFNSRSNLWYMSIYDQAGENLVVGDIPIQVNAPLTDQYVAEGLPPGRFIAIDETGKGKDPGVLDLGNRVKLIYEESSENV